MADYSMYHALGQGGAPDDDPANPQLRTQPAPPQFNPPVAPPPAGYNQAGAPPYGNQPPPQQVPYPGQPPVNYNQSPNAGFPVQQNAPQNQDPSSMAGVTAQMGGLGLTGETGGSVRAHKKKNRHAYHDLGAPAGSSQPFNGMPQPGMQGATQFLNTGLNQTPQPVPNQGFQAPQSFQQPPDAAHSSFAPATQPGFPGTGEGAVHTQGKVDPEQIPSVPRSRDLATQYYRDHVYPTMERHIPPPAAISFMAHDQGNSSPKFGRLTLNNIPTTSEFLSATSLPLGLVLQPLAPLDEGEQPVPVLDFGDSGPPRCRRCRTYINPFMMFRSGGNKFVCNMCTFPNDVPPEYFAPIDPSGTRVDRMQRPELMLGTCDFLVPREYWAQEPVGLRWLFLLDVSQESANRGFLESTCEGIMAALYGGESNDSDEKKDRKLPEGSKIGIVTFDKEVHFYNLSVCFNQFMRPLVTILLTII